MKPFRVTLAVALLALTSAFTVTRLSAAEPTAPVRPAVTPTTTAPTELKAPPAQKHFLIVLKLVPRLHDDKAWTKDEQALVGAHFRRLKAALEAGQLILAGRTEEPGDRTMGLVIFKAPDEAAAREFMLADPCVAAGVMTATLHPYGIALMKK